MVVREKDVGAVAPKREKEKEKEKGTCLPMSKIDNQFRDLFL